MAVQQQNPVHYKNPFLQLFSSQVEIPALRRVVSGIEPALEKALALTGVARMYDAMTGGRDVQDFLSRGLRAQNIVYRISPEDSEDIPRQGPGVVVCNHPFGGLEGIIILHLLLQIRPDVKVMANYLLRVIPELRDYFIFVDPFGTGSAKKANLQPLRETRNWLQSGGLLAVFPAGAVSHFQWRKCEVSDPKWDSSIARIIRSAKVPVTPVFFHGNNSAFFHLLGAIHPLLRTLQLPRELSNKRNKELLIEVGTQISQEKMRSYPSDDELISYLRLRTYILRSRAETPRRTLVWRPSFQAIKNAPRTLEPVVSAVSPDLLAEEVEALSTDQVLVEHGDFLVLCARAQQIPGVLREIGRLRELTFRAVNEGTGKCIDLDRFDNYYLHLFTWNRATREIIGGYRLVDANLIRKTMGVKGLYTHTLFAYNDALLRQMGHTLELGRSFVRLEYQRNFNSLHLLWKGIAQYAVRNPKYHGFFGTVSISSDYDVVSRYLMVSFLRENKYIPELGRLIRARNPMRTTSLRGVDAQTTSVVVKDITDVSELIAEIEAKHKSIPILLRQYLKLDGKLLGFNIDRSFGDVLDGLIYIDLRETDLRILERYMGRQGTEKFLRFHGRTERMQPTGTENA